jgi:tetratricopeptide (TPR) repeat protein
MLTRPIGGRREPEVERDIRTDLLDFVTVWADLRVRLAPAGAADEARREALQRLDEAEILLGPSASLDRVRRECAEALGLAGSLPQPVASPRSAWEHSDLGRSCLRSGEFERAADQFRQALDLRPQDFWPNFYLGLCAYQLGRFEEAITAFSICNALSPETAQCYFNRALAHDALGQAAQALRDYTRALQLDRRLTDAALNRGILYYAQGRHAEAAADLDQALETAAGRETRGVIHYNRALVCLARGDRPSALSNLEAAVGCGHDEARTLYDRLRP